MSQAASPVSQAFAPQDLGLFARMVAVPAIWGLTFLAGRVVAQAMPAALGASLRYLAATLALLLAAKLLEGGLPRLNRQQAIATFLLGVTGIWLYNLLFFGALAHLPASRTSLLVALLPAVTIATSRFVLGDPVSPRRWLGVALALLGVWTVITRGHLLSALSQSVGIGELLMFGGVLAWMAYTLIGRVALKGLTPLAATTYASLWGTGLLMLSTGRDWALLPQLQWTPTLLGSILYLGLFGTALAFVWYSEGVKRLGAGRTVVFNNLVPVFGAAFGITLLGEHFDPSMAVGGLVALLGVMIASGVIGRR